MDKSNIPESFGVFKPVGHVVVAFRSDGDMQAAERSLTEQGFSAADLVSYTPAEMVAQVDAEIVKSSPMAAIGQDLNLIKAHRELAEEGCSFLVVRAPEEAHVDKVTAVALKLNAVAAQRYGRFVTEELIEAEGAPHQTFESVDTGLDEAGAAAAATRH
ncbi:MAG: hypothetical protein ACKVOX_06095 [Rhizobacter sp.]